MGVVRVRRVVTVNDDEDVVSASALFLTFNTLVLPRKQTNKQNKKQKQTNKTKQNKQTKQNKKQKEEEEERNTGYLYANVELLVPITP